MLNQGGWIYSDTVKDHFMNPRNILKDEKEFKYDGKGRTGNVKCGDEMIVFITVDKEKTRLPIANGRRMVVPAPSPVLRFYLRWSRAWTWTRPTS